MCCRVCNHVKFWIVELIYGFLLGVKIVLEKWSLSTHLIRSIQTWDSFSDWITVVTGWFVWGVPYWDMLSLCCGEILLSEVFSNFFVAKSKNEFPADIEVLLSLAVRNFRVLNDLPSLLQFVFRSAYSSPAWVKGTLESWEFMSV